MRTIAPYVVFLMFLALWTWKLLTPVPIPEDINRQIPTDLRLLLAKSLHASAYAFLTVLAVFLPLRWSHFWVVVGVLAMHGIGTEIGQTFVPSRHGCIQDVLIDWAGISLGLLVIWSWGYLWKAAKTGTAPDPRDIRSIG
jgi:VanZ family protein